MPPPSYISIPRSEYEALAREVRGSIEACDSLVSLRGTMLALVGRLEAKIDQRPLAILTRAIDACERAMDTKLALFDFEQRLRQFDQELTPVRPPSRADIQQAFENSIEFASGKKKPPAPGG
jgi:hypothetical protein